MGQAIEGIGNAIGSVVEGVGEAIGGVMEGVAGAAGAIMGGVADAVGQIADMTPFGGALSLLGAGSMSSLFEPHGSESHGMDRRKHYQAY